MYSGKFRLNLEVVVTCTTHNECLQIANKIKKQCDAWSFCVNYDERKSVRSGPVLSRSISIMQIAYSSDVLIFREAVRRVCEHYRIYGGLIKLIDNGVIPSDVTL